MTDWQHKLLIPFENEIERLRTELTQTTADLARTRALLEQQTKVVDAARKTRQITGNRTLHNVKCNNCPCDVCEDLYEIEEAAENDLDMELIALAAATPVADSAGEPDA